MKISDKEITVAVIVLIVLVLFNTVQILRFTGTISTIDRYKDGLVDELGGFRKDISLFGEDLNEIRSFLLLPAKDYSFIEQKMEEAEEDESQGSETQQALYQFMGNLAEEARVTENIQQIQSDMTALQKDWTLRSALGKQGLSVGYLQNNDEGIAFEIYQLKEKYYALRADPSQGNIKLNSIDGGSVELKGQTLEEQRQEVIDFTQLHTAKIDEARKNGEANKALVEQTMEGAEITALLEEKRLLYSSFSYENRYEILNSDNMVLLNINIEASDGSISLNGKKIKDPESFEAMLLSALSQLDGRTQTDELVAERQRELEAVLAEEAFASLLSELNYQVASEPREEYNKLLYDVSDADGKLQFSFVIELSSGAIKILKGNEEMDLFSALTPTTKKKLCLFPPASPIMGIGQGVSKVS